MTNPWRRRAPRQSERSGAEPRGRSRRRAATETAGYGDVARRPAWIRIRARAQAAQLGRDVGGCFRWASVHMLDRFPAHIVSNCSENN